MPREFTLFRIWRDFDERSHQAYARHLARARPHIPQHLWKYFADEFFHDGNMEFVEHNLHRRTLEVKIDATNIQLRAGDSFEYLPHPLQYRCVFRGVDHLRVSRRCPAPSTGRLSWDYIACEIDTINKIPAQTRWPGRKYHSLIIESSFNWLELIFSSVKVTPVDADRARDMARRPQAVFFPFPGRVPPAWAQWRSSAARAIDGVV